MKIYSLLIIALIVSSAAFSQEQKAKEFVIAYYNCDNMFDINDDKGEYDDFFTATGKFNWGEQRYSNKLNALRDVILGLSQESFPDMLVLSGIENKSVIDDLISDRKFRKSNYSILSVNSTDFNSIYILVRESVKEMNFKKMTFAENENIGKESVLYSLAKLNDGFNYHIFMNLWPSRPEGNEYDRIRCAVAVRKEIDNILNFERDARIIVLGTFNDEPTNKSILSILNASNKRKNIDYRDFYNPFYDLHNNSDSGTMVLNGALRMYDYIVVSPQLIRKNKGYSIMFNSGEIINNGSDQPLPTFRGDEYLGGASGHFPVIIRLKSQSSGDEV